MFPETERMRPFLERLTAFKVLVWGDSSSSPDLTTDREVAELDIAHVASSLRKDGRHTLVIDLDHQCYLVRSTTPGHYHLYVDVPEGIGWDEYKTLLTALSQAGVVEPGYVRASLARGHSDVRLPWVKKP